MRLWANQAQVDEGEKDGLTSAERDKPARLRRENRRLREDIEVLKRAADLGEITRAVKHRLKNTQYRPDLLDGCIAATGLSLDG